MKLSKCFALYAVTLWSVSVNAGHKIDIAGTTIEIDVEAKNLPHTLKIMPEFIKTLQPKVDKMSTALSKEIAFLKEAFKATFPKGEPTPEYLKFYKENLEKLGTDKGPNVEAWKELPNKAVYRKFEGLIHDLEIAEELLANVSPSLIQLAVRFELETNARKKIPNSPKIENDHFIEEWLFSRHEFGKENVQEMLKRRGHFQANPEENFMAPFCSENNKPLHAFLVQKGKKPEDFWAENNIFSGTLSYFLTAELCQPFMAQLKKIAQ